jgi:hypothetical protein
MSTGRIIPYRYLKQTAQKLHDDFDSDVPKTVDVYQGLGHCCVFHVLLIRAPIDTYGPHGKNNHPITTLL